MEAHPFLLASHGRVRSNLVDSRMHSSGLESWSDVGAVGSLVHGGHLRSLFDVGL